MTVVEAITAVSEGSCIAIPSRDDEGRIIHLVVQRRDGTPVVQVLGHDDHGQHMVIVQGDELELQRVLDAQRS